MSELRSTFVKPVVLIVFLLLCIGACSGDEDGGGMSNATASSTGAILNAADTVNRVLSLLLGDHIGVEQDKARTILRTEQAVLPTSEESVEVSIPCGTGEFAFNGTIGTMAQSKTARDAVQVTIDAALPFSDCDGATGELILTGDGSVAETDITFLMLLQGSIEIDACSITFAQLSVGITANAVGLLTSPVIATGSINAACDDINLTCELHDVDIDDPAAIGSSCQEI
ncbi:MAG: hypothetical protein OEU26_27395 [Candidatus Tectomicrobia bacterium]|nr:hypothetical protein [Candidatus Tectomicrobia bacterium]